VKSEARRDGCGPECRDDHATTPGCSSEPQRFAIRLAGARPQAQDDRPALGMPDRVALTLAPAKVGAPLRVQELAYLFSGIHCTASW
jgi:hypothetical protein